MSWTIHRLRQMMCGLHGHDAVLHFERNRLSLQCVTCGLESPGWAIESETRRVKPLTAGFSHTRPGELLRSQGIFERAFGARFALPLSGSGHATT